MLFKHNNFFKIACIVLSAVFFQVYNTSVCLAEEEVSNKPEASSTQKTQSPTQSPNNNNSQTNKTPNNSQEPQQNTSQPVQPQPPVQNHNSPPTEAHVEPQPESPATPQAPPKPQNENPSIKSKKLPAKKSSPPAKKEDTPKPEEEKEEEKKDQVKVSLPEVLPDDIAPPNSVVLSTYNNEEQGNNFIKGIIAWVLIAIGVCIIIFVIISNKKISVDSSNLFQGKHDLKTKLKKSRKYNKNIRRK